MLEFLLGFVAAKTGLAQNYAAYLVNLAINGATWGTVAVFLVGAVASGGTAIFLAGGWAAFKATVVRYAVSKGSAYAIAW